MRRHLFLLHLRRLFTTAMIVCVSILAVLLVVERLVMSTAGQGAAQVPETVNVIILFALLGACFPAGAASFGKAFREQQALFLYSLPLRRLETWAILTSAAAASHVLVIAFVFLVRPSLAGMFVGAEPTGYAAGILFMLVAFAAGACFGLAAPRPVVAGATALLLIGPAIGAVFLVTADRYSPYASDERVVTDPLNFVGLALLAAVFLGLSALFFRRGEHELLTQAFARYASIGGGVILVALVLRAITAIADARLPIEAAQIALSSRGDRIAVVERHPRMRRARLRVFDARTGRALFSRRSSALLAEWTAEDRLLLVESNASAASLILPIPFASRAMLLGADGEIERTLDLPDAVNANLPPVRGGEAPILLVTSFFRGEERLSIFRIDGTSFTTLRTGAQWAGVVRPRATGDRLLATWGESGPQVFRATAPLQELPRSGRPPAETRSPVYLLDGIAHMTEKDAAAALRASYPIDDAIRAASGARRSAGGYVIISDFYRVRFLDPVWYYVPGNGGARGLLWEWTQGTWTLITDAVEHPPNMPRSTPDESGLIDLPDTATIGPGGVLFYTRSAAEGAELVVASAAGEHATRRVRPRNPNVHILARPGEGSTAVIMVSRETNSEFFVYDPRSRSLTPAAPRELEGAMEATTVRFRADGTRIDFAIEAAPEDAERIQQAGVDGPPPAPRRPSYRLIERRPDGTRSDVRLEP